MLEFMKTKLGWLRVVAFLEGVSFLLLLGIAMPLKYVWGMPEWVRAVGMGHGLLFLLFLMMVAIAGAEHDWSPKKYVLALAASVTPFGTFWADVKLFRNPS